jgi:hypothetical protein
MRDERALRANVRNTAKLGRVQGKRGHINPPGLTAAANERSVRSWEFALYPMKKKIVIAAWRVVRVVAGIGG